MRLSILGLLPWVVLIVFWVGMFAWLRRRNRAPIRSSTGDVELSRETLTVIDGGVRTIIPWTAITGVADVPGGWDIRVSDRQTVFVRRTDDDRLERALRKKLGGRLSPP